MQVFLGRIPAIILEKLSGPERTKSQSWMHCVSAGIKQVSSLCVSVVLRPEPWHIRPVHEALIHPHDPLPKAMFFFVRVKMMQIQDCITI